MVSSRGSGEQAKFSRGPFHHGVIEMFRAFADMLTVASLPIWLCTLNYTFVWRAWHFLPSILVASLLVAPLLGLAIVCEHRDAEASERPPRSFFPSPEGFAHFLFLIIL